MINQEIHKRIAELNTLYNEVTTSDLQGISQAIAIDINKKYQFEIDEILLNYAYGEITLKDCISQINFYNLEILK